MPSFQTLWDKLLFRDKGIIPTSFLLRLFLVLSFALVIISAFGVSATWLFIINGSVIVVSLIDLIFTGKPEQLSVSYIISEEIERFEETMLRLTITNHSRQPCYITLNPGLPQSFQYDEPVKTFVDGKETTTIDIPVIASIRGRYPIETCYFRYHSTLGLWDKQTTKTVSQTAKVIPNLSETKKYLEDPQKYLLREGLKVIKHKSGQGEFSKVRHYAIGDDPRKINWQQTAKLQEIMVNEFEPEHGKQLTLLIDCGRMMSAELQEEKRLEKVLEAVMAVSAAALKHGDYVRIIAFSKHIKKHIPLDRGMRHLQNIRRELYNLQPDQTESNYAAVLQQIQAKQKRRSFILLFSDIYTFLHEESALLYLKRLRRKHLFLMIGLKDETIEHLAQQYPQVVRDTMEKSMAQQQIQFKKQQKLNWQKQGISMIEADNDQLATTAITQYIQVMNQELL